METTFLLPKHRNPKVGFVYFFHSFLILAINNELGSFTAHPVIPCYEHYDPSHFVMLFVSLKDLVLLMRSH